MLQQKFLFLYSNCVFFPAFKEVIHIYTRAGPGCNHSQPPWNFRTCDPEKDCGSEVLRSSSSWQFAESMGNSFREKLHGFPNATVACQNGRMKWQAGYLFCRRSYIFSVVNKLLKLRPFWGWHFGGRPWDLHGDLSLELSARKPHQMCQMYNVEPWGGKSMAPIACSSVC